MTNEILKRFAEFQLEAGTSCEAGVVNLIESCDLEAVEDFDECMAGNELNAADDVNRLGMRDCIIPGMYARVLTIPQGMFLTGKIHKRPYIDICISGDITMKSFLADGTIESIERVNSFRFFEGKPGRKRVGFAHKDTLWVTVDPTSVSVIADAEDDITFTRMKQYLNALPGVK